MFDSIPNIQIFKYARSIASIVLRTYLFVSMYSARIFSANIYSYMTSIKMRSAMKNRRLNAQASPGICNKKMANLLYKPATNELSRLRSDKKKIERRKNLYCAFDRRFFQRALERHERLIEMRFDSSAYYTFARLCESVYVRTYVRGG